MSLTATVPVLTARGDQLNEVDGFIEKFKVVRVVAQITGEKESEERSAHTLVTIGNCKNIEIDHETGFVALTEILRYSQLLCVTNLTAVKKCAAVWFKKPTSIVISAMLQRRDRGVSQFDRIELKEMDFFVHPALLLANVEVGDSTRTWLISVAAFTFSYHQLIKAFQQTPRDFERVRDHIHALEARVAVLNSPLGIQKLIDWAQRTVKPPYPDFNYTAVAHDAVDRLALFARADLAVMKYIKKVMSVLSEDKPKRKHRKGDVSTLDVTHEQLAFLSTVAKDNGDLWFGRSAHGYELGDQAGAVVVFPSGYLYSIVGSNSHNLMKDRTALSRMESLAPYLPFEFTGYAGDMTTLALIEAQQRKGTPSKVSAKVDMEAAKAAISAYALKLTTAMIVSPVLLELVNKAKSSPVKEESVASEPIVEEAESEAETETIDS
jgi:hypothetical protein